VADLELDSGDDLGNDILATIHSLKEEAPPEEKAEAPEPAKAKAVEKAPKEEPAPTEKERDESGRFKAKEKAEEPAEATDEPAVTTEETSAEAKTVEKQPAEERVPPPPNWNGKGKVAWEKLPKAVKQEIISDYTRVNEVEKTFAPIKEVLSPHMQALTANYGSAEAGLRNLFQLSDFASKNPQGFIQWFAQQRGIQLNAPGQAAQQPAQEQAQGQAVHPAIMERLSAVQAELAQWKEQQALSSRTELQQQIDYFANDPSHPYFNDVRSHMGTLIEHGSAQTLAEAYDMAVWARKDLREQLLEQQRETERQRLAKEAEQAKAANAAKVAKAKSASGTITGSPSGGKSPDEAPDADDLEGFITSQVRKFAAR